MAKTPEGKRRSSQNALKHGLLAKWLTPTELKHSKAVVEAIIVELQPEGALQCFWAERVAFLAARLRTATFEALAAEAAERSEAMTVTARDAGKLVTTRAQGKARDLSLISRYEAALQRQLLIALRTYGTLAPARGPEPVKPKVGF